MSVLLCFNLQTALPLEGLITLHNKRMLFSEGGKVANFRISALKGKGLPAKLLSGIVPSLPLYRAFASLGKIDFKILIQTLLLSLACILVSETFRKTIWLGPVRT